MSQSFITQLEAVSRRRSWRRRAVISCWAIVAVMLAALVFIGLDRLLVIVDPVGRALWTLLFLTLCGLIVRRWLLAMQTTTVSPLQVAQEIECRYPALRDEVTSAWYFGQQTGDDPTAGSESLRRAVVLHTTTALAELAWQQLIPRKAFRQAGLALVAIAAVIAVLGYRQPQATAIGFTRLINPFSEAQWPREHDLQFIDPPEQLLAGDDLVLQLQDTRGTLPETVSIEFRTWLRGSWHTEIEELRATDASIEVCRPDVREAMKYRATGGDHFTMPWHSLEIVAPPEVEGWKVRVQPPAYTGLSANDWRPGEITYSGSRLELLGRVDRPVKQLVLQGDRDTSYQLELLSNGQDFRLAMSDWQATLSESFALHITTAEGLIRHVENLLSLEVIEDQPPQVLLVEPASDLAVLPNVIVPIAVEVTDEFGVRDVALAYRRSDRSDEGEQRQVLWQANTEPENSDDQRRRRVEFTWQLETLSLSPGSVLELRAQAHDFQIAKGQSANVLRLNIVSEDQLWEQLLQQQARIVEQLEQLLNEQTELRTNTAAWAELPTWSAAQWANSLHRSLFGQRQIVDTLTSTQGSVVTELTDVLQSIDRNRLLRPEVVERLQNAQSQLQALAAGSLTQVEVSLRELIRKPPIQAESDKGVALIARLSEQQADVSASLRSVIDLLMPGNIVGRLERELLALESDQRSLAEYCETVLASQVLLASNNNVKENDLVSAVSEQRQLAYRLAELLLDMSQASERTSDEELAIGARLAATVVLARELGVLVTMQSAGDELSAQRLGRVSTLQQQALEDLAKLRARLVGHDITGAAERWEQLQSTEQELQHLRGQVAKHEQDLAKLSQENQELARLHRQREQLADETANIEHQLQQLRIPRAAEAAAKAETQLRKPGLDRATTQQARSQLDEAQRQLTTERRRQQTALARLEMAQLDAKLTTFVDRQQGIENEIRHLDIQQSESGQLTQAQTESVANLADRQSDLRRETSIQAEDLNTLPVFGHLLQQAADRMQIVEEELNRQQLGPSTQQTAAEVSRKLKQLVDALRQQQDDLANTGKPDNSGGQGQTGDTAQEKTLQLALGQLQLLKQLQTDLQAETVRLEAEQSPGEAIQEKRFELARRQQQLAELARLLVPEPVDPRIDEVPSP